MRVNHPSHTVLTTCLISAYSFVAGVNPPCNGDFECDGDVDGRDAVKFKVDFF